jgi:predicted nucleotidyltransferase
VSDVPPAALVASIKSVLDVRAEVLEAYVFGSEARGTATSLSDLDVAVYIDRGLASETRFGYAADLAAALGAATARRDIDVVVLNEASPLLYHRVIAGGVRVFARDLRAATTREGRALSRYCDYLPQLRRIDRALADRLAAGTFGR